ncbi:adipokinetic hormone/corazonin-related peptide receptor variant I-like [Panonychus citri]|uniref:adipokinetic hormone/corazonin-related peptide receptor variant I-like n=1 Tax=Panonychus citri TaxID=50023 RepID=UPI00230805FE|nr:adipokinetic hormone/corazonin-related peptide receptor variant I-like [Panonychus citri]
MVSQLLDYNDTKLNYGLTLSSPIGILSTSSLLISESTPSMVIINSNETETSTMSNISVGQAAEIVNDHNPLIYAYYLLFGIGSCGNFYALKDLVKARQLSQYINLLMAHLTFADLCVIFISLPIEIMWQITYTWEAGDLTCRLIQVIRLFGLYLSSNIVVCISIDRLHAFTRTPNKTGYYKYSKKILISAYIISLLLSTPQAIIYRVETHPLVPGYAQCIQAAWFVDTIFEKFYTGMSLIGMYFGPLIAIVFCYCKIFFHLHYDGQSIQISESSCAFQFKAIAPRDNRDIRLVQARHQVNRFSLIQKAKYRTLKMTLIIVLAYLICWSPYVALVLYSSYDYDAAQGIDPAIHEGIILFAASHSCVNPFVYRINLVRRFPAS